MSTQQRFLCGVPERECQGSHTQLPVKWPGSRKSHASRKEAKKCYTRYMQGQGYEKVHGGLQKDDGPVIVLSKESKFGGRLRLGKEKRFMPDKGSGTATAL
jgi:hypothetical protein